MTDSATDRASTLPDYVPEQVALYQTDHLLTHKVCRFDPGWAAARLREPHEVMAIDLGGDKLRKAIYTIDDGVLSKRDETTFQSRGGAGYLAELERVAEEATARNLRVGISSATKLDGSVVSRTVNLPVFFEEFSDGYGADYARLFPGRSVVVNDTISGMCGSSALLALQGVDLDDVAFFICGSGLGASVISDGTAIHVEAAHVPLVRQLNPLGQTTRCNVPGKCYVCLERVTAARAGIEDLYCQQTGEVRDGVALGAMYTDGDPLATLLYETSALALAHAVVGVMQRYGFSEAGTGVVVFHGGTFEIGPYREAVRRKLEAIAGPRARVVYSRDLSRNACLDGAAVLAACFAPDQP